MTPEAFALLVASCLPSLPPGITADRLRTIATVESGLRADAVSPPNRNGTRDFGLMQINSIHIGKPGFPVTVEEALQPCPNLRAGVRILAAADRAASCRYNTGRLSCQNGYPERIQAAAVRLARSPAATPAPAPAAADLTKQPESESWDVFAEHAPAPSDDLPDGDDDATPSGQQPRVVVELP